MTQTYKVQVSMNQAHLVESGIVWKQGDFGFNLEIEVLDFDTTGVTPQIIFRKSAGAVESTSVTQSSNKFTYTIRGTELDTPGPGICDLKLKNSTTQRISTASFKFFVVPDTEDGLNEHAHSYSDTIEQIWETLEDYSEDSEAWAVGTKNGVPVGASDLQYLNNSKWYSDHASQIYRQLIEAMGTGTFMYDSSSGNLYYDVTPGDTYTFSIVDGYLMVDTI